MPDDFLSASPEISKAPRAIGPRIAWVFLFLVLAAGIALVILWPKISARLERRQQEAGALEELQGKVEMLERRVSELSGTVYQAQQRAEDALLRLEEAGGGATASHQGAGNIEARLEALETRQGGGPNRPDNTELRELQARLIDLEMQVASRASTLTEGTEKLVQESEQIRRSLALAASYEQLASAVEKGTSYAVYWENFAHLSANDGTLAPLAQAIAPYREKGIATADMLKREFSVAIASWSSLKRGVPSESGFLEKMKNNLRNLVVIRKVGEEHPGMSDEAALARAEAKLERGAIREALEEVKTLSPTAQKVFENWQQRAAAYLVVKDAMAKIQPVLWQNAKTAEQLR